MTSKNISEKNIKSKYTRCDTCRQDILSEKMFLHEGFCKRNNVFCEHCEKVFLKTDFDEHLKDIRNSITNSAKSTEIDENEKEEISVIPVINQTITTVVNPNTYYEFIEMPLTEEYKVNKPIVISENGNILSSKNINEYLLPFLGIPTSSDDYNNYKYDVNISKNINKNNIIYRNVFQNQINHYNNYRSYTYNNIQNNKVNSTYKIQETNNKQINKKMPQDNYNYRKKSQYNCYK